jgi:hypothetical protein
MVRYAALMMAALVVGCSQSPSPKEPGPSSRGASAKNGRASKSDTKTNSSGGRESQDNTGESPRTKVEPTGPLAEKEVRTAAVSYLTQPGKVKDVEITFVSTPIDIPQSKQKELSSSARDVKAYYVGFTGHNLIVDDRLESKNYLLIVGREPDGVKVLASYHDPQTIEQQLGKKWLTDNPPPQK